MRVAAFFVASQVIPNEASSGLNIINAPGTGFVVPRFPMTGQVVIILMLQGDTGTDPERPAFRLQLSKDRGQYNYLESWVIEWPDPNNCPVKNVHWHSAVEFTATGPGLYTIGLFSEQEGEPIAATDLWIQGG